MCIRDRGGKILDSQDGGHVRRQCGGDLLRQLSRGVFQDAALYLRRKRKTENKKEKKGKRGQPAKSRNFKFAAHGDGNVS